MKLVTVLVCGGLCIAPLASAQSGGAITLAAAVDEALAHNDRLIDQHDSVTQADLGIRVILLAHEQFPTLPYRYDVRRSQA